MREVTGGYVSKDRYWFEDKKMLWNKIFFVRFTDLVVLELVILVHCKF